MREERGEKEKKKVLEKKKRGEEKRVISLKVHILEKKEGSSCIHKDLNQQTSL